MVSWLTMGNNRRMMRNRRMGGRGTILSLAALAVGAAAFGLMRKKNIGSMAKAWINPIRKRMTAG
jgi:hypothetical protein